MYILKICEYCIYIKYVNTVCIKKYKYVLKIYKYVCIVKIGKYVLKYVTCNINS
jgi:hypothetical protein